MKDKKTFIIDIIWIGIFLFFIILFIVIGVRKREKQREYEALKEAVVITETTESESESEIIIETETEEPKIYCDKTIDFEELHETNEDIYAWITVPGTDVDYPVLQSEEDNYYLTHNLDHTGPRPGCIYSNKENTKDFSDFATILYGHDMNNGTMFGTLRSFYDRDFFEENDTIVIYTEMNRYTYQIVETRRHSDAYLPYEFDYFSEDGKAAFLQMMAEEEDDKSFIREGVEYGMEDRYIVLSTCIRYEDDKRYLIIGKLVEEAFYYE